MSALSEMTVEQASSKLVEVMLFDTEYYDSLEIFIAEFVDYPEDSLGNSSNAWSEIKYGNNNPHTAGGFTAQLVADYGGEGQGDEFWVVALISDGEVTRYFRMDGYYSSYSDGGNLDGDVYEVRPVERLVTFYETS